MTKISGRRAIAAGFRLIAREPAAFLVWCVVAFVLVVAPQLLTAGSSLAMFSSLFSGEGASSAEALAAQAKGARYQSITLLASLAAILVLPGAVFRAVLFPEERQTLYLKVGGRELWLLLAVAVLFVMYFIGILAAMIPYIVVGVVGGLIAGLTKSSVGLIVAAVLGFIALVAGLWALVWALLRFSMAPVMAFADNTFRLTESWSLTRGHAGKMFLVALALLAIMAAVEGVLAGLFIAWAGATETWESFLADPLGAFGRLGVPFLAALGVTFALLSGAGHAIWGGAWADMYRQVKAREADVFA